MTIRPGTRRTVRPVDARGDAPPADRPLRVAMIAPPWLSVPPLGYGGTESVIDTLCRGLQRRGDAVLLVASGDSACPVERTSRFDSQPGMDGGAAREIEHATYGHAAAERWGADVVHDHTLSGPALGALTLPIPVVTTCHRPLTSDLAPLHRLLTRRVPLIAISRSQPAEAGDDIEVSTVIHHGVDLVGLRDEAADANEVAGSGCGGFAMFLGRMSPDEGVDVAIDIAVAAGVPLVIGAKMREPHERQYVDDVVRPRLGPGVEYLGELDRRTQFDLLRRASCLLNPIQWNEPFGLAAIEAVAVGTPVIATPRGAMPEIVEHGVTGFLGESVTERPSSYHVDHSTPADHDTVTLSAGTSFAIVGTDGAIRATGAQGHYVDDTRLVSEWSVRIDGSALRVVETCCVGATLDVTGTIGDPTRPTLLADLRYTLTDQLTVDLVLENLTAADTEVSIDLRVSADFTDLFEVKRGVRPRGGLVAFGAVEDDLVLRSQNRGFRRGVKIHVDRPDEVFRDGIHLVEHLGPHANSTVQVRATPLTVQHPYGVISGVEHQHAWLRRTPPAPASIPALVWQRSWSDLSTLLMRDAHEPHPIVVAAGSPWFMALFGRDSLITSLETLPDRTDLALGVLQALALRQGLVDDPVTLEQPGRIPHEVRRGEAVRRPDGWGATFYGTVDATPLFVLTVAEAWRNGTDPHVVAALLPDAERTVDWILGPGDPDGDGFVEYPGTVHGHAGLANQAWKDSDDAIRHPDGSIAQGPIATVEVQAYCHAALGAMADLREEFGTGDPGPRRQRAAALADAIDERFWLDDDCYALALDGDERRVRTVASNAGHLLFTGTAAPHRAARPADRLMEDGMFTGFGIRTLNARNPAYNPLSYHCGSVWPHDTAIIAAGMHRYGSPHAATLAGALVDAADHEGRLPELFGGFSREQRDRPVPYPTSCSPQAWAAGAPLILAAHLDASR
jgi:glycosyltransferase involved in cell wall biosynthesis